LGLKSDVLDSFGTVWIRQDAVQQRSDSRLLVALAMTLPGHVNGVVKVWGGDNREASA
jgi:hypothetical protein